MFRSAALGHLAPRLLVIGLALAATGCGKIREISACRSLAREVNTTLAEIEAMNKQPSADQELRMAKRYAELAKQLEPRSVGTTGLATTLHEYVSVLRATEAALKSHAEASKNHSTARVNETKRELDRLVKRERAAVTRIDVECHT